MVTSEYLLPHLGSDIGQPASSNLEDIVGSPRGRITIIGFASCVLILSYNFAGSLHIASKRNSLRPASWMQDGWL